MTTVECTRSDILKEDGRENKRTRKKDKRWGIRENKEIKDILKGSDSKIHKIPPIKMVWSHWKNAKPNNSNANCNSNNGRGKEKRKPT